MVGIERMVGKPSIGCPANYGEQGCQREEGILRIKGGGGGGV